MVPTQLQDFFYQNENLQYQLPPKLENYNSHQIHKNSKLAFLPLQIAAPFSEMLKEAQSVDHLFVNHRNSESHRGWSSLCIHGISPQHTDSYKSYDDYKNMEEKDVPYHWTEIADQCPVTADFFKNYFPYSVYHRLRFMRLEPNGFILPHVDNTNTELTAINISLNNPQECKFVFENVGTVPFKNDGSIIIIANGVRHAVWNRSNEIRYHIIVHGYADGHKYSDFNKYVINSYDQLYG
jgi:hypothetical protein